MVEFEKIYKFVLFVVIGIVFSAIWWELVYPTLVLYPMMLLVSIVSLIVFIVAETIVINRIFNKYKGGNKMKTNMLGEVSGKYNGKHYTILIGKDGYSTKIYQDGKEMEGVQVIEVIMKATEPTKIKLEVLET